MLTPTVRHGYVEGSVANRLHYVDYGGSGRPLICMHGVTGNAWSWYEVATELSERRRVLALDFRGYGESQWSASHDYTTTDHVADLKAVVDTLDAPEVDLMGVSWGALAAIQYATDNPDKVGDVIVVDIEPSFDQGETDISPPPASHADADAVRAFVAQAFPNASSNMVALIAATCFYPVDEGRFAPKYDPFFLERWPFRSDDQWERLDRLQTTTLFVHAGDSFVRAEVMADMAARVRRSELVEVKKSTHLIPVDNPAGLLEVVRPFLNA